MGTTPSGTITNRISRREPPGGVVLQEHTAEEPAAPTFPLTGFCAGPPGAARRGSAAARPSSSDPDVAPSQEAVVRVDRSAARAGDPDGEAIRPVAGLAVVLDVGGVLAGGPVPEGAVAAEAGAELGAVDRERPDVPGQRQPAAGLVADAAGGRRPLEAGVEVEVGLLARAAPGNPAVAARLAAGRPGALGEAG